MKNQLPRHATQPTPAPDLAPVGCQLYTVADTSAFIAQLRRFAPASMPIILYECNLSNSIISNGGNHAIANGGSCAVAGGGNTVAAAPDLAQLYTIVNRLVSTVEVLTAKVEGLQKQITTQSK